MTSSRPCCRRLTPPAKNPPRTQMPHLRTNGDGRQIPVQRNEEPVSVSTAKVVGPTDGKAGFLGSIGVRFMLDGAEAGDRFAVVEHPMSARALAAPLHR